MTYAIYYIHLQSLSVNIYNFYKKYDIAVKKLNTDVADYITTTKNLNCIEFVDKKSEISTKEDGYFLKISNKYPNRINAYEKNTNKISGYLYTTEISEIKKIYVFSLLELSSLPEGINLDLDIDIKEVKKSVVPKMELLYMQELKDKIKNRLGKYE